ncbi:hypothetical protein ROA7450_03516 [Roseovarius albus]|uniref:Uncharacterized protein n=1 Tax=Roseovarius albus TaxID=1247867 RepID=A0A1X6ZZJ3_9RHOB|nr:hypothetical protein [Roseovarius albus]SLN66273.1 hypothetical protein ROA7450_03516 [Roseovarius albus]
MKLYLVRGVPRKLQQDGWWMDGDLAPTDRLAPSESKLEGSLFSRLCQFVSGH